MSETPARTPDPVEDIAALGIPKLSPEALIKLIEQTTDENLIRKIAREGNLDEQGYELLLEKHGETAIRALASRRNLPEAVRIKAYLKLESGMRVEDVRRNLLKAAISEQGLLELVEQSEGTKLRDLIENGLTCELFHSAAGCAAAMMKAADETFTTGRTFEKLVQNAPNETYQHINPDLLLEIVTPQQADYLLADQWAATGLLPAAVARIREGREVPWTLWRRIELLPELPLSDEDYYYIVGQLDPEWKTLDILDEQTLKTATRAQIDKLLPQLDTNLTELGSAVGNRTQGIWKALKENPNLGEKWLETEGLKIATRHGGGEKWANQLVEGWAKNPSKMTSCIEKIKDEREKTGKQAELTWLIYYCLASAAKRLETTGDGGAVLWESVQREITEPMIVGLRGNRDEGNIWVTHHAAYEKWPESTNLAVLREIAGNPIIVNNLSAAGAWLTEEMAKLDKTTQEALKALIRTSSLTAKDAVELAKEIGENKKAEQDQKNKRHEPRQQAGAAPAKKAAQKKAGPKLPR